MNKSGQILAQREKLGITRKEFSDALGFDKIQEKKLKLWEEGKEEIPDNIFNKIMAFPTEPKYALPLETKFTQIDLFAGIGGIRLGFQKVGGRTVFSSEWDKFAQKTYRINYGETPAGDITKISPASIPDHDILLGGFPCQPFSQAGLKKGFDDARGTLFFNIAEILKEKRPKAFMLENVKQLKRHDNGNTLKVILNILNQLNYYVPEPQVLNAYDFGVPQNRERLIIVGFNKDYLPKNFEQFNYPLGNNNNNHVGNILEKDVPEKYTISDKLYSGHLQRKIEHEKKGNGFGFHVFNSESQRTSTISARYYKDGSEALIEQEGKNPRMLTPRECARLQGFPKIWQKISLFFAAVFSQNISLKLLFLNIYSFAGQSPNVVLIVVSFFNSYPKKSAWLSASGCLPNCSSSQCPSRPSCLIFRPVRLECLPFTFSSNILIKSFLFCSIFIIFSLNEFEKTIIVSWVVII